VISLKQFPQFVQFIQQSGPKGGDSIDGRTIEKGDESSVRTATPEEAIDDSYKVLQSALKKEILDLVKKMDPYLFEQLVVDLLVAMGYGGSREEAAQVTKSSGDEGIDGVINERQAGLRRHLFAKRSAGNKPLAEKEIQSFVGATSGPAST